MTKQARRKRLHVNINLPHPGSILSMTPVEMMLGSKDHWEGVSELDRRVVGHVAVSASSRLPVEAVLFRVRADNGLCWVVGHRVTAERLIHAEQHDTLTAARRAFVAATTRKTISDAQRKVLDVLARNSERLLGPGYVGDEVWGPEESRHGSNCSAPFARVAGKMLKSLKALGYVEYVCVTASRPSLDSVDWGWRITPSGNMEIERSSV